MWIGFVLAVPTPLVACLLPVSGWLVALAFGNLIIITALVAAMGRLTVLCETELAAHDLVASRAGILHGEESAQLTDDALEERRRSKGMEDAHRLLQAEVQEAQVFHHGLVPHDIDAPSVQVRLRALPSTFLGGDYLRASLIRPACLYLCVGDVSGHGIAAALIVSRIHGLIRGLIHEDLPPQRILSEVNRQLSHLLRDTYHFMTLAVFRVDLETKRIQYATAGHPAQLLLRGGGESEELSTPNGLLGMSDSGLVVTYSSGEVAFSPGDSLVLFTDGLFEIRARESGLELGQEALRTRLAGLARLSATEILNGILDQVTSYQGNGAFPDDVSVLVARFTPDAPTEVASGDGAHLEADSPHELATSARLCP